MHGTRPLALKILAGDPDCASAVRPDELSFCCENPEDRIDPLLASLASSRNWDAVTLVAKAVISEAKSTSDPQIPYAHRIAHQWLNTNAPQATESLMLYVLEKNLQTFETFAVLSQSLSPQNKKEEASQALLQAYKCTGQRIEPLWQRLQVGAPQDGAISLTPSPVLLPYYPSAGNNEKC